MRGIGMEKLSNGHVSVGQSSQNLIPESRPFIFLALIVQMWYWKKTFMRIYGLWNLRFAPSRCDFWLRAYEGKCWVVNDWIVRDVSFDFLYIHFLRNDSPFENKYFDLVLLLLCSIIFKFNIVQPSWTISNFLN